MLKNFFPSHLLFLATICLVIFFGTGDGHASVYCDAASIQMVGPQVIGVEGKVVASLVNKTSVTIGGTWAPNTWRQFYLHPSILNQGLATLLTAYSMNKTVWVQIGGDAEPSSIIEVIYVIK